MLLVLFFSRHIVSSFVQYRSLTVWQENLIHRFTNFLLTSPFDQIWVILHRLNHGSGYRNRFVQKFDSPDCIKVEQALRHQDLSLL